MANECVSFAMRSSVTTGVWIAMVVFMGCVYGQFPGQYTLHNSIMSVVLNGNAPPGQNYPCITQLSVNGQVH
jgi:hypothetical protein